MTSIRSWFMVINNKNEICPISILIKSVLRRRGAIPYPCHEIKFGHQSFAMAHFYVIELVKCVSVEIRGDDKGVE